ncbi:CHAT domain-containing protein [Xylaria intraflava]|nr:CHAT domain-containing protein [Xylaria intraflava]
MLAMMLAARFRETDQVRDLETGISRAREALTLLSTSDTQRIETLDCLSGDDDKLIALVPWDDPLRPRYLIQLGRQLTNRSFQTGNTSELDEAISIFQEVNKALPKNHFQRIRNSDALAVMLRKRFERTEEYLLNLGGCLARRAISAYQNALKISFTKPNEEVRIKCLYSLAPLRLKRYELTGDSTQLDNAVEHHPELSRAQVTESFKIACQVRSGKADYKIISAHNAMKILSERKDWTEAGRMANIAIGLMPRASNALQNISSIAADACSISLRLGDVGQALQHVEFGRGLILGYLIDGQSDLSSLKQRDSSLANEYERLRVKASEATCERKIRQLEGFHNFLLQPFQEELKEAACDGYIVVVNISNFGSDAIVVSKSNMQALTRMNPHLQGHARHAELIQESLPRADVVFLAWLWTACVRPILERILPDFNPVPASREIPRIWWIGVGGASVLPFHAATLHGQKSSMSTLDFVIPSYTPTIKALQNARQRASRGWENSKDDSQSLLIITMPSTPGASSLSGVTREQRAIKSAVKGTYSVKELERPDAQQVLDDIQRSQIVHFACHGASDPLDPLQSHLLLQKSTDSGICLDKLTVESLLASRAQTQAWIAYLSACSTAQVKATRLMNESLHITSAFQVAGFAHVIGTMWPVSDHVSIDVARYFYEFLSQSGEGAMSSDRVVAAALRNAVVKIRREYPDNPRVWAPYLHFGA